MAPTAASLASVVTTNCLCKIWERQDWGCSQCQLQPIKCLMLRCGPIPLDSSSRQLYQRTCHLTESPHKPPVIRGQSKEAAYVMYALRSGPLNHCSNLPRRSFDSTWADFKTKIVDSILQKLALMKSPIRLCFPELLQCPPKMLPMLVNIATENQYVV